ncbi:MAG: succinate--CoA ligase subunit alpha [Desulfovibrio sp.]
MLLNEHNSKLLFQKAGVAVPPGLAVTPEKLDSFSPDFAPPWFLKAQVLTGGRGKAGGIRRVDAREDFRPTAEKILGMTIKGHVVPFLRVEPASDIQREFYLSFTVSRERRSIVLTAGREGGVEIENLGADNLLVQDIPLPGGLSDRHVRAAFFHFGLEKEQYAPFAALLRNLFCALLDNGLLLAEINPLVLTGQGDFLALDGKVEIDDNMVDLRPDLEAFHTPAHSAPEENRARSAGLSFVKLQGFVGLMVNGAGLAMATMDLLNFSDLPAANFLDLGGGADQQRMETAFDLLFSDDAVRIIFINLYGGILSCEKVALAMQGALGGKPPKKPIVARLSGNSAESGLKILRSLNAENLHLATEMGEAIAILKSLRPKDAVASPYEAPRLALPDARAAAPALSPVLSPTKAPFPFGKSTTVLVQGITGHEGRLHTELMLAYGTKVVAGVTPFKGGQEVLGVPVYSSVRQAVRAHDVQVSIIFVPPRMAAEAILEAADAGVPWVVCITEGIPQQDMLAVLTQLRGSKTRLMGPNTPGLLVPGEFKVGILPVDPFTPGNVAVLSRSGTLTYEVAARLSAARLGQSLCVGIGGDPFIGTGFTDLFALLRDHEPTRSVVVLGEIGGRAEENLAEYVQATNFPKPVVSFIAGRTAPPGRRLGHAGAILEKGGSTEDKIEAMRRAGFTVCPDLDSIAEAVRDAR